MRPLAAPRCDLAGIAEWLAVGIDVRAASHSAAFAPAGRTLVCQHCAAGKFCMDEAGGGDGGELVLCSVRAAVPSD